MAIFGEFHLCFGELAIAIIRRKSPLIATIWRNHGDFWRMSLQVQFLVNSPSPLFALPPPPAVRAQQQLVK